MRAPPDLRRNGSGSASRWRPSGYRLSTSLEPLPRGLFQSYNGLVSYETVARQRFFVLYENCAQW